MEFAILKLILVFCVIVAVMWVNQPLWIAVTAAGVATVFLYGLTPSEAGTAVYRGITARTTLETVLVFYSITYLQRMMEKRGDLMNALKAMNGLYNNNRINASIVPFLLGMLPAAGTVLICGPIVRESTKNSTLSTPEKACITSYFRHVSESFLPTYTSIFIGISLTGGRVNAASFVVAMLPMVVLLIATGWVIYLRKVPVDTGMVPDQPRRYYWKLLFRSLWAIALTVVMILVLHLKVYVAVVICIVLNVFVNRFSVKELFPFFRTAFEKRLILNTCFVLTFKEVLAATGVITALPAYFSTLPIPSFLIFTLIFFFGTLVAGSQAIIVLCIPMAMQSVGVGHSGLAMFTLMMCIAYIAMQLSPTHICLSLCSEDYKVSLGAMILRTIPLVGFFTPIAIGYYGLLSVMGF